MFDHQRIYKKVLECRVCASTGLEEIIDLGLQPLANSLLRQPNSRSTVIPLVLMRCRECSCLQISVDVDPKEMFQEYLWVTGTSNLSRQHCSWLAGQISELMRGEIFSVLEMASNDGTLLQNFKTIGASVLGVDPALNLAKLAISNGVETIPKFFNMKIAKNLKNSRALFDVVIARNVLSHIPNPIESVKALSSVLKKEGICVVEFHRADIISHELHYDSIYHEHSLYHTLQSMSRVLNESGLEPFDLLQSPISGGSWIIFSSFSDSRFVPSVRFKEAINLEKNSGVLTKKNWEVFSTKVKKHQTELYKLIDEMVRLGKTVVAYGASARSSTLLNACGLSVNQIKVIADSNQLKHGLYSPGTKIPIESPELVLARNPDVILLLAFNFREEIQEYLRKKNWQGEIVHIFPEKIRVEKFS